MVASAPSSAPTLEEIASFVREQTGAPETFAPTMDLHAELGVDGDDMSELILEYSRRFAVDIAGYRWYFHCGEEGLPLLGRLFFPPPDRRVERIPITPAMFHQYALEHRWLLEYPPHTLPKRRYDVLVDLGLFALVLGWGAFLGLRSCAQ
jgi:hypothetical protein